MRRDNYIVPPKTTMEVFESLPEGTRAELINGGLFMSPAPTTWHQEVLGELYESIKRFARLQKLGNVYFAPCDIYFDDDANAVQPDLFFISSNNHTCRRDRRAFYGAPDFIAEILSEGTIERDRIIKKALYERFGVQEYWIIDPETKQCEGFFLVDRIYQSLSSSPGKVASRLFRNNFEF
jgi:Uma2 family endonuclease